MNFVLFENENEKEYFVWANELENLPIDTTAFTYYQQDNLNENGVVQSHEYRIGIPVKFIIGGMYVQVDSNSVDNQKDVIYCLYSQNGKRKFKPLNQKNTTLVNNFSELEEVFATIIKKEQVKRK